MQSTRIAADEDIHKDDGLTEEELREKEELREAKANAQLLEMVGTLGYSGFCACVMYVIFSVQSLSLKNDGNYHPYRFFH